jgi:hypothetical protein
MERARICTYNCNCGHAQFAQGCASVHKLDSLFIVFSGVYRGHEGVGLGVQSVQAVNLFHES